MPKDYSLVPLGNYASVQGGFAFKGRDFKDSGVPVLKIKNVRLREVDTSEVEHVAEDVARGATRYRCKTGDLLISMTGSGIHAPNSVVGRVARFTGPSDRFLINQRVGRFVLKDPTKLDLRYLFYVLTRAECQSMLVSIATGSANQVNISGRQIEGVEIPLPALPEQRAIAHALGTFDEKIELNRRMNETLEAMARSRFQSCVREATSSNVPLGWRLAKLGEVLSVIETGGRPKGGVRDIAEGVPSVGAESIMGIGRFNHGITKFVPRAFFDRMNKGRVRDGDVLLYKDGGRPGEFEPHVTMVGHGFPFQEFCINEHVYRLRSEPSLPQSFLFFWLSSDQAMDEMRNRGTGVAIPGLNSTAVRELPILLPAAPVLKAFDEQMSPLLHRIFANCNESRTLAALRDALLPKLLSGEIRINPERLLEDLP